MTLTEQWKKGELEGGFYYVYLKHLEMFDIAGSSTLSGILERGNENSIEVLAPVPSYEEWQRIFHYAGKYEHEYTSCVMEYENLKQENQQLKELLYSLKCCLTSENIEPQIRVEKSLAKIDNAIGADNDKK